MIIIIIIQYFIVLYPGPRPRLRFPLFPHSTPRSLPSMRMPQSMPGLRACLAAAAIGFYCAGTKPRAGQLFVEHQARMGQRIGPIHICSPRPGGGPPEWEAQAGASGGGLPGGGGGHGGGPGPMPENGSWACIRMGTLASAAPRAGDAPWAKS